MFHWRWERAAEWCTELTKLSACHLPVQVLTVGLAAQVCNPHKEFGICADDLLLWSQHYVTDEYAYGLPPQDILAWCQDQKFYRPCFCKECNIFPSTRRLSRSSGFPGSWKWKGDAPTLPWNCLFPWFFAAAPSLSEVWLLRTRRHLKTQHAFQ